MLPGHRLLWPILVLLLSSLALAAPPRKHAPVARRSHAAQHPQQNHAQFPTDLASARAFRIAQLDGASCLRDLTRRGIAYQRLGPHRGVTTPVRLRGTLGAVRFTTGAPPAKAAELPWEVFDCRLVVALDDFSRVLAAHGVTTVIFSSAWRPPPKGWPVGKPGQRHGAALAIDVHQLRLVDGRTLDVERDFHGRLGAPLCGPQALGPEPSTPEARLLRSLVCIAVEERYFQSVLTPNYDPPHRNHFHLEVTPAVRWFIAA